MSLNDFAHNNSGTRSQFLRNNQRRRHRRQYLNGLNQMRVQHNASINNQPMLNQIVNLPTQITNNLLIKNNFLINEFFNGFSFI